MSFQGLVDAATGASNRQNALESRVTKLEEQIRLITRILETMGEITGKLSNTKQPKRRSK